MRWSAWLGGLFAAAFGFPLGCGLVVVGLFTLLVWLSIGQLPPWANEGVTAWLLDTPQPLGSELSDNAGGLSCVAAWDGFQAGLGERPEGLPLQGRPRLGCEYHDAHYTDHSGVDFPTGGVIGQAVVATLRGKVVWVGRCGGWGNLIVVENNGFQTWYAHLADGQVWVEKGEQVVRGQALGGVGSTGNSTGPHLHYGVMQKTTSGQVWRNPEFYFSREDTLEWPCSD